MRLTALTRLPRRWPLLGLLLLLIAIAALALLLGAQTAQAQTAVKLVGNTGQSNAGSGVFEGTQVAFTTGSNATGYVLTRVDLEIIASGTGTSFGASIHEDSSGSPGTSLGTLTNPSSLPSRWTITQFTASGDGIELSAGTTYFVKLAGDQASVRSTSSDAEDAGGAAGWSIANNSMIGGFSSNDVPKLGIHGHVNNNAPTVANEIPGQTAVTGTAFSYTFPADTFNDADGDTLTYTATKGDDSALPSWLTFTAGTRTFSGTPQTADIGTVSVKVTASDGTDSVSDTFDIVVKTNNAPTVANRIPHQRPVVGRAFSYTFPANTFNDADGDTLTYTSRQTDGTALPSWLTFTASTRTFSGTPPADTVPVINVLVVASDGIATAQTWFNLNMRAGNSAPTVANPIPNRTAELLAPFSYTFPANTFNDADGDALTYIAAQDDGSALPSWLTFDAGARTFSGTPQVGDAGTVSIKVTASDGTDSVSDTFDIVTEPASRVDLKDSGVGGCGGRNTCVHLPTGHAEPGPDHGEITLHWTPATTGPTAVTWTVSWSLADQDHWTRSTALSATRSHTFTLQPGTAYDVAVSGNFGAQTGHTAIAESVVTTANSAPTVANPIPPQRALPGTAFSYTFPADTFNDADGDTLTYTATKSDDSALPSWLTFDASARTFSGTPQTPTSARWRSRSPPVTARTP